MPGRLLASGGVIALVMLNSCNCVVFSKPDQSIFRPLTEITANKDAFVRIYAAPVPLVGNIAVHTWFVVKAEDVSTCDRWELWQDPVGKYDHICLNLMHPEADVGCGGTFILAETSGVAANHIIDVISAKSPEYPYRKRYRAFPGPNSNTYVQWILNESGWDLSLPAVAIGANCRCDDE